VTLLNGIILGLVQGLTEFLPVSSSGHLVLTEHFLRTGPSNVAFEVFLHLATLLAAILALRPELTRIFAFLSSAFGIRWVSIRSDSLREGKRLFWALVIGTLPAAAAGFLFKTRIESYFNNPRLVGFALLFTGLVLFSTRLAPKRGGPLEIGSAFAMGLAQALALMPGVSRSGMTVSAGLLSGVQREKAVRFSFLLSVPAILGAGVLELKDGFAMNGMSAWTLVASFLAAFVSGAIAIQILLRVVIAGRLSLLGFYCVLVGAAVLMILPH